MLPDRVSNPGPLTYESGALPIALRGPLDSLCRSNILTVLGLFRMWPLHFSFFVKRKSVLKFM